MNNGKSGYNLDINAVYLNSQSCEPDDTTRFKSAPADTIADLPGCTFSIPFMFARKPCGAFCSHLTDVGVALITLNEVFDACPDLHREDVNKVFAIKRC
jgi:hypothetical protein